MSDQSFSGLTVETRVVEDGQIVEFGVSAGGAFFSLAEYKAGDFADRLALAASQAEQQSPVTPPVEPSV